MKYPEGPFLATPWRCPIGPCLSSLFSSKDAAIRRFFPCEACYRLTLPAVAELLWQVSSEKRRLFLVPLRLPQVCSLEMCLLAVLALSLYHYLFRLSSGQAAVPAPDNQLLMANIQKSISLSFFVLSFFGAVIVSLESLDLDQIISQKGSN